MELVRVMVMMMFFLQELKRNQHTRRGAKLLVLLQLKLLLSAIHKINGRALRLQQEAIYQLHLRCENLRISNGHRDSEEKLQ